MNLHDPNAMFGHGNITLAVNGGGVFVNSNYTSGCPPGSGAMTTDGPGTDNAPVYEVVGSLCSNGTLTVVGSSTAGYPDPSIR